MIKNFIDTIGQLGTTLGLNRVVGQIYALLFLSDKPLSLDEISKNLKISKGNVSINIRELEGWGAVKKVWVPGSRKDYYEANQDTLSVIYSRLKMRLEKMFSELNSSINNWEQSYDSKGSETVRQKLKKIKETKNFMEIVIKNLPDEISGDEIIKKMSLFGKIKGFLK